eukprot:10154820-Prorocentrum_lima.AAC.1
MVKRDKGQPVTLKLAGGVVARGAMTQYGDIMPGASETSDSGWIVPVFRLTKELGMKLIWDDNE